MPDKVIFTIPLSFPEGFDELPNMEKGRTIIHLMQEGFKARELNIELVVASYEGSGDSFEGCSWTFYSSTLGSYDAEYGKEVVDIEIDFGNGYDELADFINRWVSDHYAGWENNDGGFGQVHFHLNKPHVFMNYHERYTAERHMGDHELWEAEDKDE